MADVDDDNEMDTSEQSEVRSPVLPSDSPLPTVRHRNMQTLFKLSVANEMKNRSLDGFLEDEDDPGREEDKPSREEDEARREEDEPSRGEDERSREEEDHFQSIVPVIDKVHVDNMHPAKKNTYHSLDFDRIVNAYSVIAIKKRLRRHHEKRQRRARRRTQLMGKALSSFRHIVSYKTFGSNDSDENWEKENKKQNELMLSPNGKRSTRWGLTISTGLLCGLIAIFILYGTTVISEFRTARINWQLQWVSGHANSTNIQSHYFVWDGAAAILGVSQSNYGLFVIFLEFTIYNVILVIVSTAMCSAFAPGAVGSGIPQVKAYLNGVCVETFADMNIFVTKILGTILSVSSGLMVGPEGPLVHIGAILGQGITKTSILERTLRSFQRKYPNVARDLGCGMIDTFGAEVTAFRSLQWIGQSKKRSFVRIPETIHELESAHHEDDGEVLQTSLDFDPVATSRSSSQFLMSQRASEVSPGSCCTPIPVWSRLIHQISQFRNDADRRDLITIGVATGFATAFGAPVGGLLYSVEEASSYFTIPLLWRTLAATALGTMVVAIYHGNLTHFSVLDLPTTNEKPSQLVGAFVQIPLYMLLGVTQGLMGAFFNSAYVRINTVRSKFHRKMSRSNLYASRTIEVACVSIITSAVTFWLPFILPVDITCIDMARAQKANINSNFALQFNCPDGKFNQLAAILVGERTSALNGILSFPGVVDPWALFVSAAIFFFLMIMTFGMFIPHGLFMPALLTGSAFSGWVGLLLQRYWMEDLDPAHLSLLGATALLAGIQRTTFSLCVIMMEASGQVDILIPLIICVVSARYTGDLFNEGFYHLQMEMKHFPFLEHEIRETFNIFTVSDIMTNPVVTVKSVEKAKNIEDLLSKKDYSGFPVVEKNSGQYIGLIRRDQLVALLECGIYLEEMEDWDESGPLTTSTRLTRVFYRAETDDARRALVTDDDLYSHGQRTVKLRNNRMWQSENVLHLDESEPEGSDFFDMASTKESRSSRFKKNGGLRKRPSVSNVKYEDDGRLVVQLPQEECDRHVDVAAAMNMGAYTVNQNCPVAKAYQLFCALGLRHLPVLGKEGAIVGILSRSNFIPEHMEESTGIQMHV